MKKKRDGKDRISSLPDDVLIHILSFLPSNEAIATSLLSSRWRSLWTLVPSLDFVVSTLPTKKSEDRVNKFMTLRRTQSIKRHRLKFKNHSCHSLDVQLYVSPAITGKIEQFNISLCQCHYHDLSLPSTLFTSTTIVTLKLKGWFSLSVPSSVHLPSLKNLHLDVGKCNPCFKGLFFGSPSLEVFYLKQRLGFDCSNELKIVRNSREVSLVEKRPCFDLVIQSDRDCDFVQDYLEDHLEKIVKAKVYATVPEMKRSVAHHYVLSHRFVLHIIRGLRNVEFLSFCDFSKLGKGLWEPFAKLPRFENLVKLELCLGNVDSLFMEIRAEPQCPKLQAHQITSEEEVVVIKRIVMKWTGLGSMEKAFDFVSMVVDRATFAESVV
ncbi:F-box-like domain superfamily [Sesbania bispinosa]|nr:F-box-like domain superfamily [Sesbania bispinosa]